MYKKLNSKIKIALIFDLDGTLIHSLPDMHLAINKTLEEFNLKKITEKQLGLFVGQGMLRLSERVVKFCDGDESLICPVYNSYRRNYSDVPYKFSTFMKGVHVTLKKLSEKNIPLSICTNKRQFVTEKLLKQMKVNHYFKTIVGAQDGVPLKPNKAMIEKVIKNLNLKNHSFFMIGDTFNDVEAARLSGIKSVFVKGGYSERSVENFKADFTLNEMSELLSLLNV